MDARTRRVLAAVSGLVVLVGFGLGCSPSGSKSAEPSEPSAEIAEQDASDRSGEPSNEAPASLGLRNGRTPQDGLLTGGQPTQDVLEGAAAAGYRTVIDLRTDGEDRGFDEPAEVKRLGMTYIALPIDGVEALNESNAQTLADALQRAETPILLHCGSGNRVGALLALKAFHIDGADPGSALDFGREAGLTSLEDAVEALLNSETTDS